MNIVEAYIKINSQLVILLSGMSGCGKNDVGKFISRDFKIPLLQQIDYYKQDYNKTVILPNGESVVNLHADDAIDWNKLNTDLNRLKNNGVVLVGIALPEDKISVKPNFHIHMSISKKACLDRRRQFIEKHKDEYPEEYKNLESSTEKLKMNQLIFPYYLEIIKRSKINKFINIENKTDQDIYDEIFDYIINKIETELYKNRNDINLIEPIRSDSINTTTSNLQTLTKKQLKEATKMEQYNIKQQEAKRKKECDKAIKRAGEVVQKEWKLKHNIQDENEPFELHWL